MKNNGSAEPQYTDEELNEKIYEVLKEIIEGSTSEYTYNQVAHRLGIPTQWKKVRRILEWMVQNDEGTVFLSIKRHIPQDKLDDIAKNPDKKRKLKVTLSGKFETAKVYKWSKPKKYLDKNKNKEIYITYKVMERFLSINGFQSRYAILNFVNRTFGTLGHEKFKTITFPTILETYGDKIESYDMPPNRPGGRTVTMYRNIPPIT